MAITSGDSDASDDCLEALQTTLLFATPLMEKAGEPFVLLVGGVTTLQAAVVVVVVVVTKAPGCLSPLLREFCEEDILPWTALEVTTRVKALAPPLGRAGYVKRRARGDSPSLGSDFWLVCRGRVCETRPMADWEADWDGESGRMVRTCCFCLTSVDKDTQ